MPRDILLELDDQVIENLKLKARLYDRSLEVQIVTMLNDAAPRDDSGHDTSPPNQITMP